MNKAVLEQAGIELDFDAARTLPNLLAGFLADQPDHIALVEGDKERSYAEMVRRIYQIANGLIALGVGKGDRVAALSRNSMAYSELFAATLCAGACMVPLQTMIADGSFDLMLKDCAAKVLVVSEEFSSCADLFLSNQTQLVAGGLLGFDFANTKFADFEQWLSSQDSHAPGVVIGPTDEFNIIYSSGTTGVPKGIVHSHKTRQGLARGMIPLGFSPASVNLIATPLYSNTTFTTWWPSLCVGATQVVMSKFSAEGALALIERHNVSHAMLVPVQYDRIMRSVKFDDHKLDSLEVKFSTSAPLRAALKADVIDRFPGELFEFYGMTEGGAGTLFVGSVARELDKLGSVGTPLPGTTMKILAEDGTELSAGETGEIVGRGANMSNGYLNRKDANTDMSWFDKDGLLYFKTGDVGYLDEDGWLFLSDRKKDMIISGGFNIYATDLELVLLQHEAVHEVAVVALPSANWGETPLAIVVREPETAVAEDEVREWANERLGKLQEISQLVYIDDLPKSSIGKVLKRELRERYKSLGDA